MVKIGNLLNLCRKIGLENVSQLNTAKKAVNKGLIEPLDVKLIFTGKQMKSLSSSLRGTELAKGFERSLVLSQLALKYAPKAYADTAKHVINVRATKFGPESFSLKVDTSSDNFISKVRLLGNNAGGRLKVAGKSELGAADVDIAVLDKASIPLDDPSKFLEKINVVKKRKHLFTPKMTRISVPPTRDPGYTAAIDVELRSKYLDKVTDIFTQGRYQDASKFFNDLPKLI